MLAAPPAASRPRPPRAAAVPGEARATRRPRLASRRLAVCCTAAASTSSGPGGGAQTGGERPREDWGTISSAGGSSSSSSTQSSDSEDGAQPFQEGYYDWRWGSRIKYYQAGDSGPPLVLVHGGEGGNGRLASAVAVLFTFGDCVPAVAAAALSERFRVYAFDLLGQGGSWPGSAGEVEPDPDLGPLVYSAETWTRQLLEFMRDIAGVAPGAPAYVAGNSLGGFLAVNLAGQHPEMVKGLVLLNASE
ncbi:hypothetical protein MNEG_13482 [Monoraphidium neglectum]|uniref:AB hydrolase-1 domain-containing protein n=1 Tax=Monoraphidium neglectum TaxID=145388 RepID=A0A0D2LYF2_9CHLO|nr:hypothetical protein MNEG_13482 [Monoraphidium neglectum]KIY94481.1 hypothetical protein MNEG_13482 [Monoraphidium neglectum]|eukprot:XP_013893501.1 hypothetical protein MNEG_13482 [Monoraphidium neglectum]